MPTIPIALHRECFEQWSKPALNRLLCMCMLFGYEQLNNNIKNWESKYRNWAHLHTKKAGYQYNQSLSLFLPSSTDAICYPLGLKYYKKQNICPMQKDISLCKSGRRRMNERKRTKNIFIIFSLSLSSHAAHIVVAVVVSFFAGTVIVVVVVGIIFACCCCCCCNSTVVAGLMLFHAPTKHSFDRHLLEGIE